jgi:hypothetical protein
VNFQNKNVSIYSVTVYIKININLLTEKVHIVILLCSFLDGSPYSIIIVSCCHFNPVFTIHDDDLIAIGTAVLFSSS